MVVETPDINISMTELLVESQLFDPKSVGEDKKLGADAKILDTFILKFNGEPDYEIIDLGNGKGRNIIRYDMDKIEKKSNSFYQCSSSRYIKRGARSYCCLERLFI